MFTEAKIGRQYYFVFNFHPEKGHKVIIGN